MLVSTAPTRAGAAKMNIIGVDGVGGVAAT